MGAKEHTGWQRI